MLRALRVLRGDAEGSVRLPLEAPPLPTGPPSPPRDKIEQLHFLFYILGPHVNISVKKSTHGLKKKDEIVPFW